METGSSFCIFEALAATPRLPRPEELRGDFRGSLGAFLGPRPFEFAIAKTAQNTGSEYPGCSRGVAATRFWRYLAQMKGVFGAAAV